MAVFAVPFRRPIPSLIRADEWQVLSEEPQLLPEFLPHWDYNTELSIARTLAVDVEGVLAACGLGQSERLKIAVVWSSPGSFLRGLLCSVVLEAGGGSAEVALRGVLKGGEAVGSVRIDTLLLLGREQSSAQLLSPTRAGSILWHDTVTVAVEGRAPRFPIEIIDFSSVSWAPTGAAWLLNWNPFDLHQPFLGAVRLFINSGHETVVRAASGAVADTEAAAIRSAIFFDTGRTIIRGALSNEEFVAQPHGYDRGSIGSAAAQLIESLFPGDSPLALKNMMTERAEYFDSLLQSKLDLFRS